MNTSEAISKSLNDHGVFASFVDTHHGAAVDLIEFRLSNGTKLAKVHTIVGDLALAVGVESVRILAPIPGTTNIGIEVPAAERATVDYTQVGHVVETDPGVLPFPVGQQVGNGVIWADLAEAPHMLIAGATGSGKSVALNTILTSLIDHVDATSLRIHLVDPKRVELGQFKTAPQVESFVTDVDDAVDLLDALVDEMETRYEAFENAGVRNIAEYNASTVYDAQDIRVGHSRRYLPYHVLVIDEMADLMGQRKDDVEAAVQRLTQLARAAGIHLIIATQRPSVNVITGVIKANIPTRWAFTVASQTDSRVILDANGAEALYGAGDSLWAPYGSTKALRVQGVWTSDAEVERAVKSAKARHAFLTEPVVQSTLNSRAANAGDLLTLEDMGLSDEIEANRQVSPTSQEGQIRAIVRSELDLGDTQAVVEEMHARAAEAAALAIPPGEPGHIEYHVSEPVIYNVFHEATTNFVDQVIADREIRGNQALAWAKLATVWVALAAVIALVVTR